MRLLELFSGTGSVKKAVGHLFTEVISLDILASFNPTICCSILDWDYRQFPPDHFDAIWASPPCTEYSAILYSRPERPRDLAMANQIVARTLDIIQYFNPDKWFLENPQTGLLKDQEILFGVPYTDVDYCRYGFAYRTRTRIWTNTDYQGKLCNKQCGFMVEGRHRFAIGNHSYEEYWDRGTQDRLHQRYAIPSQLVLELFTST